MPVPSSQWHLQNGDSTRQGLSLVADEQSEHAAAAACIWWCSIAGRHCPGRCQHDAASASCREGCQLPLIFNRSSRFPAASATTRLLSSPSLPPCPARPSPSPPTDRPPAAERSARVPCARLLQPTQRPHLNESCAGRGRTALGHSPTQQRAAHNPLPASATTRQLLPPVQPRARPHARTTPTMPAIAAGSSVRRPITARA